MRRFTLLLATMICTISVAIAQQNVQGVVLDAGNNEPIVGASVRVKGNPASGATTNIDGNFTFRAPAGAKTLVVSYVGYKTLEVAITSGKMRILLSEDSEALDDVVVVGYGAARRQGSIVSSVVRVNAKDLEAKPSPNPLEALQGKVSGLSVLSNSGEPSQLASISLRGTGSLGASSTPLYILDGVPVEAGLILSMNQNDFENVQVLKDASATSIYGARAANGVIFITSKRGRAGDRASVTIRGQYGISNLANPDYFEKLMTRDQLAKFWEETGFRKGKDLQDHLEKYPHDTRWYKYLYQEDRPMYQMDMAVSGGAGRTSYYLSAALTDQKGLRVRSNYKKEALRLNLNTVLSKKLTLGTNNILTIDHVQTTPTGVGGMRSGLWTMLTPMTTPFGPDGKELDQTVGGVTMYTPGYEASKNPHMGTTTAIATSSFLQYKPLDALTLKTQVGYELSHYRYYANVLPSHGSSLGNGSRRDDFSQTSTFTWTNTAEYKFKLAEDHNFILLGGHEFVDYDFNEFMASGKGLSDDRLISLSMTSKEKEVSSGFAQYAFLSFFGRLSYDYKGRYFIDFTYRNDASSRFGANHRNGNFWSIGTKWAIKKENFLRDVKWVNDLGLKFSVGTQGNAGIGNYGAYALVSKSGQYNSQPGFGISSAGNPDLAWEKQFSASIGIETRLFDKLDLTVELYHRLTSDMLMSVPYPYDTGFIDSNGNNNITQNVGKYQNRGLDLSIKYDFFRNEKKRAYLSAYANVGYNIDKVVELFQGLNQWTIPNTAVTYIVGQPVMYFYPIWAGVNPKNGDAQWYIPGESNAIKTTDPSKVVNKFSEGLEQNTGIRRRTPWTGGWGINAAYAGFSLDADFAFALGKHMISNDNFFYENPSQWAGYNTRSTVTDYWKKDGDKTRFPRYGVRFTEFDSRMISDASFMRLKNLTLGYTLPKELLNKTKFIKGAKFYITGRNLLTFTSFEGPDPEPDSNLTLAPNPNTKQLVFGAELNF